MLPLFKLDSMLQSTDTYGFEYVASAAARSAMQSAHLWMNYESGRILGYQNSCHGNYLQAKHWGDFSPPTHANSCNCFYPRVEMNLAEDARLCDWWHLWAAER